MEKRSDLDFTVSDSGLISSFVLGMGYRQFLTFAEYVRSLTYGRTSDVQNILAIIKEQRGTCSSKHLLLASLAHECGRTDIQLMVGIYKMSEDNTPGVGDVLKPFGLNYVPEAHNYLKFRDQRYDFTGIKAGRFSPFDSLVFEEPIALNNFQKTKKTWHEAEINKFAKQVKFDARRVWEIREACIEALSVKST